MAHTAEPPPAAIPSAPTPEPQVLDNPAWHSLTGRHRALSEGNDRVRRYLPDVSPFAAVRGWDDPRVWDDILALAGPAADFPFTGAEPQAPQGWSRSLIGDGVQLVESPALAPQRDRPEVAGLVRLGEADIPEMLALVERTEPGPFLPGTYRLGTYLGIRRHGRLVAMAGERLQPPGWTEISAVCTDEEFRGQGLASQLVLAVAAGIHERGERALLHASVTNENAIRLYLNLGFVLRRHTHFGIVHTPA